MRLKDMESVVREKLLQEAIQNDRVEIAAERALFFEKHKTVSALTNSQTLLNEIETLSTSELAICTDIHAI